MSKIIRLASTNYKRLRAVEITPDPNGHLVIIAGANGQGKSSVLDSITAALGGVDARKTPKPIHTGEDKAEIVLETEDIIVTRKFSNAGSTLKVTAPDGATYPKGQAKLDDLLGKLSLDPAEFTRQTDREQVATLLGLVDLDFDPETLDAERKGVFATRTDWNRNVKELAARAQAFGNRPHDLPAQEVSVAELLEEHRTAEAHNGRCNDAETERVYAWEEVRRLTEELEAAKERANRASEQVKANLPPVDLSAIQEKISGAEETNRQVRHHQEGETVKARLVEAESASAELTAKLEAFDARKAKGLAAAKFPVDGLGFDDGGVTYQGVPFKQASAAEQLRVSLGMAIALNPTLRVIRIADASLLDEGSMALVKATAEEHDYQVWLEVVGDGGENGIIIEDGNTV